MATAEVEMGVNIESFGVRLENITAVDWDAESTVWRATTDKGLVFTETGNNPTLDLVVTMLRMSYLAED